MPLLEISGSYSRRDQDVFLNGLAYVMPYLGHTEFEIDNGEEYPLYGSGEHLNEPSENDEMIPYRRLWSAVLNRALDDWISESPVYISRYRGRNVYEIDHNKVLKQSVLNWFLSNENDVGSFIWICHQLDLNDRWLLEKIQDAEWCHRMKHEVLNNRKFSRYTCSAERARKILANQEEQEAEDATSE